jgi:Arc/MetJ family transcription regulator
MVNRMKTTVEITDSLLDAARKLATKRGTTLRALVESGLRRVLAEEGDEAFHLRDASFTGRGLQPEFRDAGWSELRDAAYESRGA